MIDGIFIYPLLTAAIYHLGARALITHWLWSRYPDWLDSGARCPACSGFWYGIACGLLGILTGTPFLGSTAWWAIPIIGLASIIWTPIIAAAQEKAILAIGAE